jgi:hypothetical protein
MVSRSTREYKFSTDGDSISISSSLYDQYADVAAAASIDWLGQGTDAISFG